MIHVYEYPNTEERNKNKKELGTFFGTAHNPEELTNLVDKKTPKSALNYFNDNDQAMSLDEAMEALGGIFDEFSGWWV